MTTDPAIILVAYNLSKATPGSPEAQAAHGELIENLKPHLTQNEFLELSFLDPLSGQVLASTSPTEEGKFKEDRPYYVKGKIEPYVQNLYYSISLQSIAMTASSPLKTRQGELVGVLTGRLNLGEMNEIINRRTGLHQTDDAYLVNSSSFFITQPRFLRIRQFSSAQSIPRRSINV